MRRATRLVVACLSGVLLAAGLVGYLRRPARATDATAPSAAALDVVINEVAWMGTAISNLDEWVELYNTTGSTIPLTGWTISFVDGSPETITLSGEIGPYGYYLLERAEKAVSDIEADLVYGDGTIDNIDERMILSDPLRTIIDSANLDGGPWPAGVGHSSSGLSYATMERIDPTLPDTDANWCTNDGENRNGMDAEGGPINGTPKARNSCYAPPPADLVVAKTGPASVAPPCPITYRIALSNAGRTTAIATVLTDTLPDAVDFITQASPFTLVVSGHDLVWQVGHVPTGELRLITVTAYVTGGAPGPLVNLVTATASTSETTPANNYAAWQTRTSTTSTLYMPFASRNYAPPAYGVIVEAVLYDGLQLYDDDEAVSLLNGSDGDIGLTGWQLCKWGSSDWACAALPSISIASHQRLWLARSRVSFAASFGFDPDYVLSGWQGLANGGDEVVLRDEAGIVRDAVVFKNGTTSIPGWEGATVWPYGGANFALEGQVLYRYADEETGMPPDDTDAAADWAQYAGDPWHGRRVRYPGWDLDRFSRPALSASGAVTVGIAPDNAYQVVLDAVRSAEETIELELYTLEHYGLVTELVQQAQHGVSVTVLLEGSPAGGVADQELWACQQLHATGNGRCYFLVSSDTLRIHSRYTFLHAKSIILDRKRLLVGSQNLTHIGLPSDDKGNGTGGSRGVVVVTDAPEIVARAVTMFQADCDPDNHPDISLWGPGNVMGYGPPPPGFTPDTGGDWVTYTVQFPQPLEATGTWFELVTAPESALRTSDALLGLVARAGAGDVVYVEQFYEHPDWGDPVSAPNLRLRSYIDAARRGARVRILLNGGTFGIPSFPLTENVEAAAYVNATAQAEGLDLSAHLGDPTACGIHNKMVLVDLGAEGKYAHVGSLNGSETSSKANREMALQVRSAVLFNYLYAMFDFDWAHQPPLGHLLISEVMYRPSDNPLSGEWIEVYNPTAENVDLSGWYLGDMTAEVGALPDEWGEGMYRFPAGSTLPAGGVIVVAQQAADVGFTPDYEFLLDPYRDAAGVPNMTRVDPGSGDGFALDNTGDEIVLRDADGAAVDVVVYGSGTFVGIVPHPGGVNSGHSLERRPPERDTDNCDEDFLDRYPPTPGALP